MDLKAKVRDMEKQQAKTTKLLADLNDQLGVLSKELGELVAVLYLPVAVIVLADAASEATAEGSPPLSLRYTGLGQPGHSKREAAVRARLDKCRRSGAVLVLLRHGESEWNAKDQFTGWADVGMTDEGRKQAVNAGHRLAASGVRRFDDLHSSALKRTVDTLSVVLEALSGASLPKGPRGTVSRSEMPRGTQDPVWKSTWCTEEKKKLPREASLGRRYCQSAPFDTRLPLPGLSSCSLSNETENGCVL